MLGLSGSGQEYVQCMVLMPSPSQMWWVFFQGMALAIVAETEPSVHSSISLCLLKLTSWPMGHLVNVN